LFEKLFGKPCQSLVEVAMSKLHEIERELHANHPALFADFANQSLGKSAQIIEDAVVAMQKRDWIVTGIRGQIVSGLRGQHADSIGNGSRNYKVAPSSHSPANKALHAVGQGTLWEAFNIAALHTVPVCFLVIRPNLQSAPLAKQSAGSVMESATSLGIASVQVSPEQVASVVERFRANEHAGPCVMEVHVS
jgi:hypothetical protein